MGNRGRLHNPQREIVRPYNGRRWIACLLRFKERRREVMTPGRYTELFFLDEAVAFAAGHRPCAECRRPAFRAFVEAWGGMARAPEIDAKLHAARIDGRGNKVTWQAELDALPDGCFVQISGGAWLVWDDALFLWSPERYVKREKRPRGITVTVLTPAPAVECFRRGYSPQVHESLCD